MSTLLLEVRDLRVHFDVPGRWPFQVRRLKAVDGVSFDLAPGETLGIVGESGCGKTTLARGILGLVRVTAGRVALEGLELTQLDRGALRRQRQHAQIVFQDPLASLDPRMTAGQIIGEPLRTFHPTLSRETAREQVGDMMAKVGLLPSQVNGYPHEFSGGQCQRIGIARALIAGPRLVICDEPVSALDVSIQAQILNLLMVLQAELGIGLIFIAHDLAVVRHVSHRVAVMYLGRIVELADRDRLYASPSHPYTRALIEAVPVPDPAVERVRQRAVLEGELPSPLDPPSGCHFRARCPYAVARCATETPELRDVGPSRVACHRAEEI